MSGIKKYLKEDKGFTLVEIIVVIVLLSIVFGIVAKGVFGKADMAKWNANKLKAEQLKGQLELYRLQNNSFPNKLEELVNQSLIKEEDLEDVWGNRFRYSTENEDRTFSLTSLGSDGVTGGSGPNQDLTVKP
ncbi:MAG: type II secretion system protein GspG [Deltaproteobacteria bacterium]|nr:type II secretion system protein GspG [Deltaproteobacteria bacterium]